MNYWERRYNEQHDTLHRMEDELASCRAARDAAEASLAHAVETLATVRIKCAEQSERAEKAQAQRDRLAAALREIANGKPTPLAREALQAVQQIAREALSVLGGETDG